MPEEKVIIIGGGPAGIACAVQLKRYGIDPLIIERFEIGGLVKNAWRLDNYAGYPDGISGVLLVEKLRGHLERFHIRNLKLETRNSKFLDGNFCLDAGNEHFTCEFLVIASGTKPKSRMDDFTGRYSDRLLDEVFPIRDVSRKKIAIIGAGDAAFDYAMTLAAENEVHIFNRGDQIKCIPALYALAIKQKNISYTDRSILVAIDIRKDRFYPVFNDPEAQSPDSFDYIIFATGREPELSCMSDELKKMQSKLEQQGRLYVIGDVKNGMVRQTSVATGDGIKAAMAIVERSKEDEGNQQDTGA